MKKSIITIILFTLIINFSYSQEKNFIDQNYIEVIGKVEQQIEPDEIYLSIVLDENDFKKGINIEDKELKMVNALKNLGINTEENLLIQNFNGNYKHFLLKKNSVIKRKSYQLLINNSNLLGNVFHTLDNMNISNVSISKVDHSKLKELKFKLKAKAIKIAKNKAESYANVIDQTVGKALFIQEVSTNNYASNGFINSNVVIRGLSINQSHDKKEFSQLSLQKITISNTVTVKFELK